MCVGYSVLIAATNRKTASTNRKGKSVQRRLLLGWSTPRFGDTVGKTQGSPGQNTANSVEHHDNPTGREAAASVVGSAGRVSQGGAAAFERPARHRGLVRGLRAPCRPGPGAEDLARACPVSLLAPADRNRAA